MKYIMIFIIAISLVSADDYYKGRPEQKTLHDAIIRRAEKRERKKTIALYIVGCIFSGTAIGCMSWSIHELRRIK